MIRFCVAGLLIVSACARPPLKESALTHAYRLIDLQRTDEAIAFLNEILSEDSESHDLQVALASAYAHKAGVKVQRFAKLLIAIRTHPDLQHAWNPRPLRDESWGQRVNQTASDIAQLLQTLAQFLVFYQSIPLIDESSRVYLEHAIEILNNLSNPQPKDAAYRALLRIMVLKHSVAQDLVARLATPDCRVDWDTIQFVVVQLGRMLTAIVDDEMQARPSQIENLRNLRVELVQHTLSLTSTLSSLTLADEASRALIRQQTIQQGFARPCDLSAPALSSAF